MKFKRERTPSRWLVQDLYLRDTWGYTYYLSRPRRFNLRRFFVWAVVIFGLVDLLFACVLLFSLVLIPRVNRLTAQRPAANRAAPIAVAQPTASGKLAIPVRTATAVTARRPPTPPRARPTNTPAARARTAVPTAAAALDIAQTNLSPARTISVALPATLNEAALVVPVPPEPPDCTPADQMSDVVSVSVRLCAGQTYRPFVVRGENIGVFGDPTAVIRAQGRAFGIVAEGARILIQKVVVRAETDAADAASFLCLYPDCKGSPGGVAYGGGILVRAADTTVMDSDIAGGVSGIAAERVSGLKVLNNQLDNSSGWGSYNFAVEQSQFVGNSWSNDNRSCTTAEGAYLSSGCESAGWVCIACQKNIIARNSCTNSGNCFYINGEGNLTSNFNRFHQNECRASPHNCFEVTFSTGNEFVENVARDDPATGAACQYPFWVGGSSVIFARNTWACAISAETALQNAIASTFVPTTVENK